jgi:hypothetical protein
VMMDGATFVVHGDTRSFWVKLWHSSPEQTRIERVQIISCLPSTRGVQILVDDPEDFDDDEEDDFEDEEDLDDEGGDYAEDDEDAAEVNDDDVRSAALGEGPPDVDDDGRP